MMHIPLIFHIQFLFLFSIAGLFLLKFKSIFANTISKYNHSILICKYF